MSNLCYVQFNAVSKFVSPVEHYQLREVGSYLGPMPFLNNFRLTLIRE